MKTLDTKMKALSATRRRSVEARAAQLIAAEKSLAELRKAQNLTQASVARALKMGQDQISRIESREDLRISTLRKYVEGLGGTLTLTAEFPDREPVLLARFGTSDAEASRTRRRGPKPRVRSKV